MRPVLMRSWVGPAMAMIAAALAGHAMALEASGKAIAVLRNTAASGPGGDRPLVTQGAVYSGDVIKTDRRGTAQILFADNTKMVIGPNAQITVDQFVFQGKSTASAFSIDAVRGSFRFITGLSAKNAYSINTPTATLGVRGTAFDGHVAKDGTTTLAMWHGSVRICDKKQPRRHCTVVSGACSVIQVDPGTGFNWVKDVYKRTDLIAQRMPLAFRQQRLAAGFHVASRGCQIYNLDSGPQRGDDSPVPAAAPQSQRSLLTVPGVPALGGASGFRPSRVNSPASGGNRPCGGNCGVGNGGGGGNGTSNEGRSIRAVIN